MRGFLFDLDGTMYTDAGAVPGALEAIGALRSRGIPFRFVTNTTGVETHTPLRVFGGADILEIQHLVRQVVVAEDVAGFLAQVEKEGGPPEDRLRTLILAFVHMIIDELRGTALTMDLSALSPRLLKKVIAKRDRFDRGIRRILREGMASGAFAPGDPKLLTFAILGAINWITRWFDPRGPARSEEIGRVFADYLLAGLRA